MARWDQKNLSILMIMSTKARSEAYFSLLNIRVGKRRESSYRMMSKCKVFTNHEGLHIFLNDVIHLVAYPSECSHDFN